MNPFSFARSAGYKPDDILSYFAKAIPGFEGKISQAAAAGYTTEQVLEFLQKQFSGAKVNPKVQKQLDPYFQEEGIFGKKGALPDRPQGMEGELATLGGAAAGGLAGAALGGPAGAVQGAVAGATSVGDVLKSYDKHTAEGGRLGLADFLKAAAKGVGSAAVAQGIYGMLSQLGEGDAQEGQEIAPEDVPPGDAPLIEEPTTIDVTPEPGMGQEQAQEVLSQAGLLERLQNIAGNNPPAALAATARAILGKGRVGAFEKNFGASVEDIVTAAFPEKEQAQPEVEVPVVEQPEEPLTLSAETPTITAETPIVSEEPKKKAKKADRGHPELQKYISEIGKINTGPRGNLSKDAKELQALKSSNVRYADYDAEDQKLQVLFAPSGTSKSGQIYEYFDVPKGDVEKMMEGSGTAVTTGANSFRAWFGGKNPSIGRAFHDFIKKKDDAGDSVYPYRKISESYVKDKDLLKVRGADTVFKTTQYVDAFEDLVLKSQSKTRAEGLKLVSDTLKEIPDNILSEMIFEVTKAVSGEVKQAKGKGKQKRYKGGREKEIQSRVEQKAAAAKARNRGGG